MYRRANEIWGRAVTYLTSSQRLIKAFTGESVSTSDEDHILLCPANKRDGECMYDVCLKRAATGYALT